MKEIKQYLIDFQKRKFETFERELKVGRVSRGQTSTTLVEVKVEVKPRPH